MSWLEADSTGTTAENFVGKNATFQMIQSNAAGIKTEGKMASKQDAEIEEIGKGFVARSPNGHRWRITVQNSGALVTVDLDA